MWKKSTEFIKDHLSSDILEKYGSGKEEPKQPDNLQSNDGEVEESKAKSLSENTVQESLPVEPCKTLDEEQDVNPPESLPVEPTKTLDEEQEVNPPEDHESLPVESTKTLDEEQDVYPPGDQVSLPVDLPRR